MTAKSVELSPPWYTLQKKFANTFGCDPAVTVGELDTSKNPYVLPIVVDEEKKGTSLRTIIPVNFPMGNINVVTTVKNSKGSCWEAIIVENEKQLLEVITAAFTGNPLFVEAKPSVLPPNFQRVGLIMTKTVVQFFNDDLSDFYSNFNGVTAHVVADLIRMTYVNNTVYIVMGTAVTEQRKA